MAENPDPKRPSRVMVVDDDPLICAWIEDVLSDHGLGVICALSGEAALRVVEGDEDLAALVTDVDLGRGLTGFDIARAARRRWKDLPVVHMSGDADERTFRLNGVPGSRFLFKPFSAPELAQALGLGGAAPQPDAGLGAAAV